MLNLRKSFKATNINVFRELKEKMFKELNKHVLMSEQMGNVKRVMETVKKESNVPHW